MTPTINAIQKQLAAGGKVWLDAGTGTELQVRGAPMHPKVWCGMAHMTNPETVRSIHVDYIKAGVDIITTNTFSTNRNMLDPAGLGDQLVDINESAVKRALEARDQAAVDRPVVVAGSMSHQVPIQSGTTKRQLDFLPDAATASANFSEMAGVLKDSGVDMILLEMMSDPQLAKPALTAALDTGLPVWMGMSCKMNNAGELISYSIPELSFKEICAEIIDPRLGAVGIMHSSINYIPDAIDTIRQHFDGPTMAYPDSGFFTMPDWNFENIISPADFANTSKAWSAQGVQILGGCCGLGIEHIEALIGAYA